MIFAAIGALLLYFALESWIPKPRPKFIRSKAETLEEAAKQFEALDHDLARILAELAAVQSHLILRRQDDSIEEIAQEAERFLDALNAANYCANELRKKELGLAYETSVIERSRSLLGLALEQFTKEEEQATSPSAPMSGASNPLDVLEARLSVGNRS